MGKFKVFCGYDCVQKKNKKVDEGEKKKNDDNNQKKKKKKKRKSKKMSKKKNKKVDEGEKKKNDDNNQKQQGGAEEDGGGKKDNSNAGNGVVLKIDLHCEGCASKIVKYIRSFEGAEGVKVDSGSGKIMVAGKVDPVKLREKLEEKTHKKVELLSAVPKKDKENAKSKNDDAAGDGKDGKKKDSKDNNNSSKKDKKDDKNSKERQITTAVLKLSLHCEGCIQKIHKIITKTKGYQEMKVDKEKDLVTVKGAMDVKELVETLKKHLKRDVEIVPPKKDDKKEKGNAGGGGGEAKAAAAAGGGGESGGGGGERMEGNKMQQQVQFGPFEYGYPSPSPFVYGGPSYVGDPYQFHYHAPQMFSDENPNACSVM